jgi:O-antigen/teichoic acid export membrane protein
VASIGRHALLYAIGQVLGKAVAFLMLPIYTRFLTPADYGVVALIDMTLDVIAIVAGAAIAQGIFRFYHKALTDSERAAVVSTALAALGVSFVIFGAVIFAASGFISRVIFGSLANAGLIRIGAMSFALSAMLLVPLAYGRVRERSGLVVGANLVKLVLQVGLNLIFIVGMGMGVRGVFLSTLLANLVLGLGLTAWAVREVGLRVSPPVLRSLVRYGVPLMGTQAATFTMTFADRYFLQAAGNETMVGLYNLAYQFGFLLLMLGFVPVEMIWGPRRFQVANSPDPGPVLAKAFRLINVSIVTIGVGIALFVGDVLRIMSTPPFHPAAAIVPVILVAYIFHGWAMMHDIGVLVKERTEYLTLANWTAAVVALGAFAVLIPRWYAFGAAAAAVLAFSVRWGLTYWFSQRLWPVRYDWAPIVRLLAVAVAIVTAAGLLPRMALPASVALHLGMLGLFGVLVWIVPVLTLEEKAGARAAASRLRAALAARVRG